MCHILANKDTDLRAGKLFYYTPSCSGVASSISGGGDIFIYSYSQTVKTINFKRN